MEAAEQKQTIVSLYVCLIACTILSCVPNMTCALFSLILFFSVLIAAYWYKFRDSEDGLLYNHMVYLIGTIWIGSSFLAIGIIVAAAMVYEKGDHSIIMQVANNLMDVVMMSEAQLYQMALNYISANRDILLSTALVTIGPAVLYLVYRIANGLSRGMKGYRIANPRTWL